LISCGFRILTNRRALYAGIPSALPSTKLKIHFCGFLISLRAYGSAGAAFRLFALPICYQNATPPAKSIISNLKFFYLILLVEFDVIKL
jgi:hypothetical protein